ncbi:unnamed protein product [Caenorhabditis brenneri]
MDGVNPSNEGLVERGKFENSQKCSLRITMKIQLLHSLRCTSHNDRELVDSTSSKIPRIRLCSKRSGDKCLVVIYTGVEQFLRWEISKKDDGVVIERSENCYDYSGFKRIVVPDIGDPLEVGVSILKRLVAHESIKVNVFEWDFPSPYVDDYRREIIDKITRYLNGDMFHAKEITLVVFGVNDGVDFLDDLPKIIHGFKKVSKLKRFISSPESCVPVKTMELERRFVNLFTSSEHSFYEKDDFVEGSIKRHILRAIMQSDEECVCSMVEREVATDNAPPDQCNEIQRTEEDGLIKLTYNTKCGKYTTTMLPKDEQLLKDQLVNMECGMNWLCKKCGDHFEYWYHQNLVMRYAFEDDWSIFVVMNREDTMNQYTSLYGSLNERPKPSKSSWGFKKE